jgi:hypothetical protein
VTFNSVGLRHISLIDVARKLACGPSVSRHLVLSCSKVHLDRRGPAVARVVIRQG